MRFSPLIVVIPLVVPSAAFGHDSWLVADSSSAAPGERVRVAFVTAEVFPVSEQATDPDRVVDWAVVHEGVRRSVIGYRVEGADLAAKVRLPEVGMHVIGLALQQRFIEIEAEGFNAYLKDERADAALAARAAAGTDDEPGRELYTKFGKTFVEVGGASNDTSYRDPVGHTLEIVPLSNPCRWNAGDEVLVQVLYNGEPAPGLRVSSGHEGLPKHTYVEHVTTDDQGVARIKLTRPGLWFLRTHTIHRLRQAAAAGSSQQAPKDPTASPPAQWRSFWASITFRVARTTGVAGGAPQRR